MSIFAGSRPLTAAGHAWFANWGIQSAVSIASWVWPWAPRMNLRRRCLGHSRHIARLLGVVSFGRVARRIHPLVFERRSLSSVRDAMLRAETTHSITFVIVTLLTIVIAVFDSIVSALFLALWNVLF